MMRDGGIRINIEHPGGVFICQCEHWQIPLFFLWKNANGYSPSPPKIKACLLAGFYFSMRDGEIRIRIEHPSGMFIGQCAHWLIPLFFPSGKTQTDNRLTARDFSSQINKSGLPCGSN
ncbi:MAG: hypothetical protein SO441_02715 [Candidatus Limivicinus sp.]|nr:hypothetical protein [Candidatus Limivicinus sp.]